MRQHDFIGRPNSRIHATSQLCAFAAVLVLLLCSSANALLSRKDAAGWTLQHPNNKDHVVALQTTRDPPTQAHTKISRKSASQSQQLRVSKAPTLPHGISSDSSTPRHSSPANTSTPAKTFTNSDSPTLLLGNLSSTAPASTAASATSPAQPGAASQCVNEQPGLQVAFYCDIPSEIAINGNSDAQRATCGASVAMPSHTSMNFAASDLRQLTANSSLASCTSEYSLSLRGFFQLDQSSPYTLYLRANATSATMKIDGEEVIHLSNGITWQSYNIAITAGTLHEIQVLYLPGSVQDPYVAVLLSEDYSENLQDLINIKQCSTQASSVAPDCISSSAARLAKSPGAQRTTETPSAAATPRSPNIRPSDIRPSVQSLSQSPPGGSMDGCAGPWTPDETAREDEMLKLVNIARSSPRDCGIYGHFPPVPPVAFSPQLRCAARKHSKELGTVANIAQDAVGSNQAATSRIAGPGTGYDRASIGENSAAGSTAAGVHEGFLKSDNHCANIMSNNFNRLGVGCYHDISPGETQTYYWTEEYGRA